MVHSSQNLQLIFVFLHEAKIYDIVMMISGPKQPGNDIDAYLRPFIEDL